MSRNVTGTAGFEESKEPSPDHLQMQKRTKFEKEQEAEIEANANANPNPAEQVFEMVAEKQSASERINLQDIMQLRTAFLTADNSNDGELSLKEFIAAFGKVLGKGLNYKQLNQLFMRIDADSGGTVDWNEFMNYMLIENTTLSSMKQEHSRYEKIEKKDPSPHDFQHAHSKNITCMIIIKPQDLMQESAYQKNNQPHKMSVAEYSKKVKFVTGASDGLVKVWSGMKLHLDTYFKVSKYSVTALAFMTHSKRLAVATTDRMISFYGLDGSTWKSNVPPMSRIEDLPAVPLCLEYYKHNHVGMDAKKNSDEKKPLETLLWGDDLGIITMYNFTETNWHICKYKGYTRKDRDYLECDKADILLNYNDRQWKHDSLKDTLNIYKTLDQKEKEEEAALENGAAASTSTSGIETTGGGGGGKKKATASKLEAAKANKDETGDEKIQKKREAMENKRPTQYKGIETGFTSLKVHTHWGWVTKLKYYLDLNMLLSSSLDGFIHMHDLETLIYRQKRTFNLHQKGINSFVYSVKHKQVASCGEERHIILWEPYTLQPLSYLNGHNTSVSHLDINEDRNHLISLGTDKVVKIWDTRQYECIQTIIDRVTYRPEDILSALTYDPITHHIIVCSITVKFWPFKTQEEIKTSHESAVSFARYNHHFDAVVSGDDGGFIAVWDIENGKLMSKFQTKSNVSPQLSKSTNPKITTGTFDMKGRRLITSAADGTVKIWNFSNGQQLKDLLSADEKPRVDTEITALISIHDPPKKKDQKDTVQKVKNPCFLAVGWDKKLHIWIDPAHNEDDDGEEDDAISCRDLPATTPPYVHTQDIMSCTFDVKTMLIFTGGVDGTIVAWNLETGFARYYLHEYDPTCRSDNHVKDSKSVDALVVLDEKRILISMSADQILRFWDLTDMQSQKGPILTMNADHYNEYSKDQLTGLAVTAENDRFVTTDTSGRIKMFNMGRVDFRDESETQEQKLAKISNPWFINAHRELINSVEMVFQKDEIYDDDDDSEEIELPPDLAPEERMPWPDVFVLTASQDQDILLHRLSNGVKIGQFAQDEPWNIYDMTPYDKIRPNYVQFWLENKRVKWRAMITDKIEKAKALGMIPHDEEFKPKLSTKDRLKQAGINVGFSEELSLGSDNMSTGYGEDFDVDGLDSEEDDLADQDKFKGQNLAEIQNVSRRDMTAVQRRKWLNDDGNEGRYKIAIRLKPKRDYVIKRQKETRKATHKLLEEYRNKNDL